MPRWTLADIPSQAGKTAIVTGSTSGVGFQTAKALARAGSRVFVAARDPAKGAHTINLIRADWAAADVFFEPLDLGSRASIDAFAARIADRTAVVDLLVNNAGLMAIPRRLETEDGFEQQFGTNHLGHFALTALLWPLIRAGDGARVVTVSSLAHRGGRLDFHDINSVRRYRATGAYAQSKLANLAFAIELQRRIEAAGAAVASIAAHPGISKTNLYVTGQMMGARGAWSRIKTSIGDRVFAIIGSRAGEGALPLLYASVAEEAQGGAYYGPNAWGETRGFPAPAAISERALNRQDAERLWSLSENLTGIRFRVDLPGSGVTVPISSGRS
jgi:NAD(P)-dependent dehydrogenase (short-subunit alcohol dehydrogenase family)